MITIHQFPCLSDNYGFLVHDAATGMCATIDTPDADAILAALADRGWRLSHILNTHWHPDHAGGNAALVEATGARVYGPQEVSRIAALPDVVVGAGDIVALGALEARVLDVGGHTLGHIAYVFDAHKVAFVGDAVFALGCGRLFEGTATQMWDSLNRIMALPSDTTLYCAHEYTQSNARFALHVDPLNEALVARAGEIDALRAAGKPTVPMTLALELATNPFLRAGSADRFAELRAAKDTFK
ncbi:MAG: hydroxyacylglutathione hydrolase [Caulobacterales bacterium]|jgi:hydroxyacylglutathione hydrolase